MVLGLGFENVKILRRGWGTTRKLNKAACNPAEIKVDYL
jgi:hypothetical protein